MKQRVTEKIRKDYSIGCEMTDDELSTEFSGSLREAAAECGVSFGDLIDCIKEIIRPEIEKIARRLP